jgi:hypothetical protein
MPDSTILCWRNQTTVKQLRDWIAAGNRVAIADFLWNRFDERYFAPIHALSLIQKNGFAIMAVSCLVIEALEAYHRGWESSHGRSELAFCSFMDREAEFHVFKGRAQDFYRHVRCGILHQAETTGGWTITLMPGKPLFDSAELRVQADEFHGALARTLKAYTDAIASSTQTAETWQNCVAKLKATIKNCG